MRVVTGVVLIARGFAGMRIGPADPLVLGALGMAAALLLVAGFWTPVAGTLTAALGLWNAISKPGDPWADILLATIGAGLALLGPGAWSIDARLFGWKRIDVRDRRT